MERHLASAFDGHNWLRVLDEFFNLQILIQVSDIQHVPERSEICDPIEDDTGSGQGSKILPVAVGFRWVYAWSLKLEVLRPG